MNAAAPRHVTRLVLLLWALALAALPVRAQTDAPQQDGEAITQTQRQNDVEVALTTTRRPLTLASTIEVEVRVDAPADVALDAVAPAARRAEPLGGFIVLARRLEGPVLLPRGATRRILHLSLVPDLPGQAILPSLEVRAASAATGARILVRTEPVVFDVRSALAEGEDAAPADLRPARTPPDRGANDAPLALRLTLLAVGFAAAVGAIVAVLRQKRRPAPAPTAAEEALDAIAALVAAHDRADIDLERLIADLADALRRYIERTRSIAAPDRTTEELLGEASTRDDFSEEQRRTLRSFLRRADRVKFAGDLEAARHAVDAVREARVFIEADARPASSNAPANAA
jgi:hypothetical protein